jgi:hypothetical protein
LAFCRLFVFSGRKGDNWRFGVLSSFREEVINLRCLQFCSDENRDLDFSM